MANHVYQLELGCRRLPLRNCLLRGGSDELVDFSYSIWLVEQPDGLLLIDSGFRSEVAERRGISFARSAAQALSELGVSSHEVSTIVLTHLHFDHAGSLDDFPNAEVHLQRSDLDFYSGPFMRFPLCSSAVEAADLEAIATIKAAGRLRLLDGDAEIARGVRVHHVGGHTPGMQLVSVQGDTRRVVLASDAAHLYENLAMAVPFPVLHDVPSSCVAFEVMQQLADSTTDLIPGHDAQVLRRFDRVTGAAASFAVQLS
jgi:glyoxylase-like metal-dependent hydrolase (beta-lactamase superfamily II)